MSHKGFKNLQKHINLILDASKSEENYIKVIGLCRKFILTNNKSTNTYNSQSINNIVNFKAPDVERFLFDKLKIKSQNSNVINAYLVQKPVPPSSFIYDAVNGHADPHLNKVALRQLLYRKKDLETSIHLVKQNHELCGIHGLKRFQRNALLWLGGILSFHGLLEMVIKTQIIHAIFDMYFINLSMLALFINGSRYESILWRPVTSLLHKHVYDLEYQLCAKFVSIYKELFTTNVTNFHGSDSKLIKKFQDDLQYDNEEMDILVHKELRALGMMIPEGQQEQMFKEYWDSSGEGFEWIEPDKDPVEFIDINSVD